MYEETNISQISNKNLVFLSQHFSDIIIIPQVKPSQGKAKQGQARPRQAKPVRLSHRLVLQSLNRFPAVVKCSLLVEYLDPNEQSWPQNLFLPYQWRLKTLLCPLFSHPLTSPRGYCKETKHFKIFSEQRAKNLIVSSQKLAIIFFSNGW